MQKERAIRGFIEELAHRHDHFFDNEPARTDSARGQRTTGSPTAPRSQRDKSARGAWVLPSPLHLDSVTFSPKALAA